MRRIYRVQVPGGNLIWGNCAVVKEKSTKESPAPAAKGRKSGNKRTPHPACLWVSDHVPLSESESFQQDETEANQTEIPGNYVSKHHALDPSHGVVDPTAVPDLGFAISMLVVAFVDEEMQGFRADEL